MAIKIGDTLIIGEVRMGTCSQCGKHDDIRPYGPGGSLICIDCGIKDMAGTKQRALRTFGRFKRVINAEQG